MFCSKCGVENPQTAGFCLKCGNSLGSSQGNPETSNVESSSTKITAYRDNKNLLVARRGAALPPLCVKCGSVGVFHTYNFSWMNPGYFLLFFLGILPYFIARLLLRRTVRLSVPLCDRHYNRSHKLMIAAWVCIAASIPVGFFVASVGASQDNVILAFFSGFGVLVIGFVIMWAHYPLTATLIEADHAELSGACSDFLQSLPPRPV
jgi:hypothetical protein